MTKPSDTETAEGLAGDELGDVLDLNDAQIELLRASIIQHGSRIAALDAKLDQQIQDLHHVRLVVTQINNRMQRIIERLGLGKG